MVIIINLFGGYGTGKSTTAVGDNAHLSVYEKIFKEV